MKRDSKSYVPVQGFIRNQTALKFKSLCALNELSISEAIEQAVTLWIDQQEVSK